MKTKVVILVIALLSFYSAQTKHYNTYHLPDEIMPVELVYFYANPEGSIINLFWGTATEVNNYGYDIERADDNYSFAVIGFMPGHGNSFSPKDYFFADTSITTNGIYRYRLKQIDTDGVFEFTDTIDVTINSVDVTTEKILIPGYKLFQNYPNPFNPSTKISFEISVTSQVQLKIFDALGREIVTLLNSELQPGHYEYSFSTQNIPDVARPNSISSGTYFYSISIDDGKKKFIETKKMTIIK
ncbi:MAG: T9SS C-terminal target domain-containing protein [Ignavibacteriales bacterium]|nr:MAG: T9SS C-terminal target domain-containing protein [Ignavibacteriales bacterium]